MLRVLVLVCAAASLALASDTTGPRAIFDMHWSEFEPLVDGNGDGKLSATELNGMMRKLGIDPVTQIFPVCSYSPCSIENLVTRYDAGGDGQLDADEVYGMIGNEPNVGMAILNALGNTPDPEAAAALMSSAMSPSPALVAAAAKVAKSFTVAGKLFAGDRSQILFRFATWYGVSVDQLILSIGAVGSSRMSRRKLQQQEYTVRAPPLE